MKKALDIINGALLAVLLIVCAYIFYVAPWDQMPEVMEGLWKR